MNDDRRQAEYLLAELIETRGLLAEATGNLIALNRERPLECVERTIAKVRELQGHSLFAPREAA